MRYPNHIILDVSKSHNTNITSNWTSSYKSFITKTNHFNNTLFILNNIKLSQKSITGLNSSTVTIKTPTLNNQFKITTFNTSTKAQSLLWSLFDINFLKKEKIYTKLKYSRSPQYDIVSGGVAALFAGFLGFLISEKFGIELVDSGDFYTFFMYIVFLCFSTRPFFRIMSKKNTVYHFISLKYLLDYLYTLTFLFFKSLIKVYQFLTFNHSNSISTVSNFIINNEYFSFFIKNISKIINFFKNYPIKK